MAHSPLHDATALLWATAFAYFRKPDINVEEAAWTTDYDPACTINGTPEERIAFLRKTKSFAARLNARKVTFEDLHTANEAKLAYAWPADPNSKSGLSYDASSADQAYVNHLAFGFGNNCDAIEQFMLTTDCPLHRQKWDDRPDYRRATILKAVAIPKQWKGARTSTAPVSAAVRTAAVQTQEQLQNPSFAPTRPPTELVAPPPPRADGTPAPPAVLAPALPTMLVNNKDKFEAILDYVERTLESDGLLSFDIFRGAVMIQRGIVRVPMTDTDMIQMRLLFEREKNFAPVAKELMRDACQLVAERRTFDSGVEWLDAQVWDGVPRVDTFMATHFGAADDEYTRAVGRYMWSGLAGRMYEPGCQLDMVIALQSKQGTKKSTGLKALAPDPEYFTDGLSLHEDDDNFKRLLRGKVIVEIAELAGLSRGDINVVKRAITRTSEKWIEKYQTKETTYLRRCMLFATTNENEFLPPDETGHRRWLPVEIVELNRELITRDRAQLWAEGAAIWREAGIQYADAERLATGRHKKHETSDVWDYRISEWLTATPPAGEPPYLRSLTLAEVLEGAIRMQPSHMDQKAEKRAGRILRQLGYEPRSVKTASGAVTRRWVLNVPPPPDA